LRLDELDSYVVILAGLLCEVLLESVDDDDFESVLLVFEDDA